MDGLFIGKLAVRQLSRRKKVGFVPLYHQSALCVICAARIKKGLASH
jgi:hypothetical protein